MRIMTLVFCFMVAPVLLWGDGIEEVRKEKNLSRRSERALGYAEESMTKARELTAGLGAREELQRALTGVVEGCELALESLRETGRPPRRLTRQYKRGELRTRDLIRQLENLAHALGLDDRPAAEEARKKVSVIHEKFLSGVMDKK